jgi:hypothetical protein
MFSERRLNKFSAPRPPTPTAAILSLSLNGLYPAAFNEGTLPQRNGVIARALPLAAASNEPKKKYLRVILNSDNVLPSR